MEPFLKLSYIIKMILEEYKSPEVYNWAKVPKEYEEVIGSITVVEMSNEKEVI